VDGSIAQCSTTITGELTIAEVLQKVAHMACCVLYQDRDGIMRLEPRNQLLRDYEITQDLSYSHPEFEITKPLKAVDVRYGENEHLSLPVGTVGEVQTVDNDFVQTAADAHRVATATAELLKGRKTISGEFRADPRLDATDLITVESKFATNTVIISEIEYSTTGGGFRGRFTGRLVENG
jgi:hypothetical protein